MFHKGHAANLKVAASLNIFLETNKTCCIIKTLAVIALKVVANEKRVAAYLK